MGKFPLTLEVVFVQAVALWAEVPDKLVHTVFCA